MPSWDFFLDREMLADTIEVAAAWDRIDRIYDTVVAALAGAPGVVMASGHSSHGYAQGTNIYFTFVQNPADWSRADNSGKYSVVLPGPGRYLVVSTAEGWSPMSEIQEFEANSSRRHLRLRDPLALAGRVAYAGEPLDGAMVSVTRPTGEVVGSVHTDADGRYAMTLPPGGHNIITVVTPDQQLTRSRKVLVVATQSNTVDIDLG